MVNLSNPNLTLHPPRSMRVRLGGYAHLPRLLDKARAFLANQNGDYNYNCPLDRRFFAFTRIDHEEFLAAVQGGKSDTEMLAWVNARTTRQHFEAVAWSDWLVRNGPGDASMHEWFASVIKADAPGRDDLQTYADLLDLDDYVSYGGRG